MNDEDCFSKSRRQALVALGVGAALSSLPFRVFAQNKTLVAASGIDAYFTAFPMARDKRIFANLGLDYTYKSFDDGAVAADAVLTNNADVAAASATSAMTRWDRGGKLYLVGSMATSSILYAIAVNSKIKTPQDLQGKTIGFPKFTSAQLFFEEYVKNCGVLHSPSMTVLLEQIFAPKLPRLLVAMTILLFVQWLLGSVLLLVPFVLTVAALFCLAEDTANSRRLFKTVIARLSLSRQR